MVDAEDSLDSRMHTVKLILNFVLNFPEALEQPTVGDKFQDCAEGGLGWVEGVLRGLRARQGTGMRVVGASRYASILVL